MVNFSGKVMADFDNNAIPDAHKVITAELIEARQNKESLEKIMEEELTGKAA